MKKGIRILFTDKLIKISIFASLFMIIIQGIFTFITLPSLPPLVPLLNSQPWGIERLVPSVSVLLILPIFIFIFLINNLFSIVIYKNNSLIARILSFNAMLFILLGVIAYLQIVLLVL